MLPLSIIALVGPTASGKTEAGIRIAQAVDGEVVCVDSRTVYRGMDIGTAKPVGERGDMWAHGWDIRRLFKTESAVIVDGVPHWGIDLVDPDEPYTVADFAAYARQKIEEIVQRGRIPVLVGGTGLYFRALLDGLTLTDVPPDAALRTTLEAQSTEELVDMLGERDPDATATIDRANRRRLIRALEIVLATGEPLVSQQRNVAVPYDVCWIGMDVDRDVLNERIDARVDAMIARGLVDEARRMQQRYGAEGQAMSGIGYRQLVAFFEGHLSLRDAIERIKRDTRHYAKRQRTWFRADARILWVREVHDAIAVAKEFLAR